jgi:hypothetical protein
VAKDFKLLAEAYSRIYEAGEETGAVTKPTSSDASGASSNTQTAAAVAPTDTTQAPKVNLSNSDASKILKGISDIYVKTKDITAILQKNNVPGLAASLEAEKAKLAQTVNTVLISTPGVKDTRTRNSMLAGLDPDIVKIANAPATTQPQAGSTPQTAPTAPVTPAAPTLSQPAGQPAQVTNAGIPAAGTEEPIGQPAPTAPVAAPAAIAAPAQAPATQDGPYYIMTTNGPRLATKGTPGAYRINRPAANK